MLPKYYAFELRHMKPEAIERFHGKVEKRGPGECWLWKGSIRTSKGFSYGVFGWNGLLIGAHRLAYLLHYGTLDPNLTIDHVAVRGCTSKLCCNPSHLEQVTQSENSRRQYQSPLRLYRLTCKHGHAKEFGARVCRRCAVQAVRRSQAKRPDYYRRMSTRLRREQRQRARARL